MQVYYVKTSRGKWKSQEQDMIDSILMRCSNMLEIDWSRVEMHDDGDHPTQRGILNLSKQLILHLVGKCKSLCIIADSTVDWSNWGKIDETWQRTVLYRSVVFE